MKNDRKLCGYYIYYETNSGLAGVDKKVDGQTHALQEYFDFTKIVISREKKNIIKSILWRLPFGSFGRNYNEVFKQITKTPDFLYVRFVPVDRKFIRFIEALRKRFPDVTILLEVATYPYSRELLHNFTMLPFYFKDLWYHRKLKKYVDRVVTFSDDDNIWGIPTIKTMNGIWMADVELPHKSDHGNKIILLAVAVFQRAHGYERCIQGLADYYHNGGDRKIEFHLVGDGKELSYYKKIIQKNHIENYVICHGRKTGKELETYYEMADIALGCFGLYKNGLDRSSALKTREYLAKGLPTISGCSEDIFEGKDVEFFYQFPNNKNPIDMNEVIAFYDKIYRNGRDKDDVAMEIRSFAEKTIDMNVTMRPVVQYIMENNSLS